MKKKKLVAATMSLILLMTGCSNVKVQEESAGTSVSSAAAGVEDTKMTDSVKASSEPYRYEYKQIAVSDMFRDTMGEDMYEAYCNFITAIENGETSFECSDEYICVLGDCAP